MGLFDRVRAWFEDRPVSPRPPAPNEILDINPTTGLAMIAGIDSPDVAGNHLASTCIGTTTISIDTIADPAASTTVSHRHDDGFSSHSYDHGHDP